jgi:hypothetical protein
MQPPSNTGIGGNINFRPEVKRSYWVNYTPRELSEVSFISGDGKFAVLVSFREPPIPSIVLSLPGNNHCVCDIKSWVIE